MILIVGLGNPGKEYHQSRHNIGFTIADRLNKELGNLNPVIKFNSELVRLFFEGLELLIIKPLTYMNNSGNPVSRIIRHFGDEIDRMLVLHDDLDIEFGTIRFKSGGGTGGHNGLESIVSYLKTDDFDRLRFGIGRPPAHIDPAEFVLAGFKRKELKELDYLTSRSCDAIRDYIRYGIEHAMNVYNRTG